MNRAQWYGQRLCEQLGLAPNQVSSITLHLDAVNIVRITVELAPRHADAMGGELEELLTAVASDPATVVAIETEDTPDAV